MKKVKIILDTYKKHEENGIQIFYNGDILNLKNEEITANELYKMYINQIDKMYNNIFGLFSIVIYDTIKNTILILQDFLGYNEPLYFYKDCKQVIITNSIKIILNQKIYWDFENNKIIKNFLKYGFIDNKQTLIKQINKVPTKKNLYIDLNKDTVNFINKKLEFNKKYNKEISKKQYINTFKQIINKYIYNLKDKKISMTLSSGYDSNLILYSIKEQIKSEKISAFCIGAKNKNDELINTKNIVETYKNIELFTREVSNNTLKQYPQIVLELEGAVYERGIFMQYELLNLLKSKDVKNLILGECADEICNINFPKCKGKRRFIYNRKINFSQKGNALNIASYIIIKKNGILMNKNKIRCFYPFIQKNFLDMITPKIRRINKQKKIFHKQAIKEVISKDIYKYIESKPGCISIDNLFKNKDDITKLNNIAINTDFYNNYKNILNKYKKEEDFYLKILYLDLFKKIFIEKEYEKGIKNKTMSDFY